MEHIHLLQIHFSHTLPFPPSCSICLMVDTHVVSSSFTFVRSGLASPSEITLPSDCSSVLFVLLSFGLSVHPHSVYLRRYMFVVRASADLSIWFPSPFLLQSGCTGSNTAGRNPLPLPSYITVYAWVFSFTTQHYYQGVTIVIMKKPC